MNFLLIVIAVLIFAGLMTYLVPLDPDGGKHKPSKRDNDYWPD